MIQTVTEEIFYLEYVIIAKIFLFCKCDQCVDIRLSDKQIDYLGIRKAFKVIAFLCRLSISVGITVRLLFVR